MGKQIRRPNSSTALIYAESYFWFDHVGLYESRLSNDLASKKEGSPDGVASARSVILECGLGVTVSKSLPNLIKKNQHESNV